MVKGLVMHKFVGKKFSDKPCVWAGITKRYMVKIKWVLTTQEMVEYSVSPLETSSKAEL